MANKKRLIYAEDALVGLQYISMFGDVNDNMIQGAMRLARSKIENAPTVDAVEVVRCKDCKYFVQGEPYDPCECTKWMVKWGVAYTTPDGYCHKAEVKDK